MSTPEPTSGVPVWARRHRKPGNPLVGLVVVPLFLFGALTAGLAIKEKSFTGAGARMDGWVATACHQVKDALGDLTGKPAKAKTLAPEKAEAAPLKAEGAAAATPAPATPAVAAKSGGKGG